MRRDRIWQLFHIPIGVNTVHLVEGFAFDPEFRVAELHLTHSHPNTKKASPAVMP